jgi:ribosomal protein S18 acetylase RimI-like enzyme
MPVVLHFILQALIILSPGAEFLSKLKIAVWGWVDYIILVSIQIRLGNAMKFVEATVNDVPALHEFEKKCFHRPEDQFPTRNLRHLIVSSTSLTLLVKDESGKIIGEVIGLLRHFKIPSGRVYKIGVAPDIQQRGMGSALLQKIEEWFVENGMKKSCAEIRENNKASRGMFEKNGYTEEGFLPFYYANGENGIKYWKNL